jgi:tRNA dimethylallyltransferase
LDLPVKLGRKGPLNEPFQGVAVAFQEQLKKDFLPSFRRVIILAGPTGVGKTALSIKLAERLGGEIISADSMQVYRGMDIGTAKVSKEERMRVPHHLIDICDIDEPFHVVQFYTRAKTICQDILDRGKVPLVVGGTGFYIHALLYGPPAGPPSDGAIRKILQEDFEKFGIEPLFEKLQQFDSTYAGTITKNDIHKVIRALEIIEISGKPVSDFPWRKRPLEPYFDFRPWFLYIPRQGLYELLEKRCDEMLKKGLLEEVLKLDRLGIRSNPTAAQAIGYRESLAFLDGAQQEEDYKTFRTSFVRGSRHLAKRQFTWFRHEKIFRWLDLSSHSEEEVLDLIIEDYKKQDPPLLEERGPRTQ